MRDVITKERKCQNKNIKNGYIPYFSKNSRILNRKNLKNINGSQKYLWDDIHMMEITYDNIKAFAEQLKIYGWNQ